MAQIWSSSHTWSSAPAELIQELGTFLGAREWSAARLVCRHWRAHITSGVTTLDLDLERDAHRWSMVVNAVRRLFPALKGAGLLVGTRVGCREFGQRMAELAFSIDLQELELRYVPAAFPRLGATLADVRGVAELRRLRSLKLSGGPTPSVKCIEALSRLKRLQDLEVLPGDYGVCYGDMLPPNEGSESPVTYGLTDDHVAPMERLTGLTSLLMKVKPDAFSQHGLASLALLPELQSLVVYDAELPSSALAVLRAASKLTALQVGVLDVADLRPLMQLPNLQDLYLDTCALQDMRRLPAAAAAAGLPLSGPRALTGLYCVDQLFPSQDHLSCIAELSGLRELVLEGPALSIYGLPGGQAAAAGGPPLMVHGQDGANGLPQQVAQWGGEQAEAGPNAAAAPAAAEVAGQQQPLPPALQAVDEDSDGDGASGSGSDDDDASEWHALVAGAAAGAANAGAAPAPGASAGLWPPGPHRVTLDLTPLSRLTALEVLQIDKREEGDEFGAVRIWMPPAAISALSAGWNALHTLDLYNVGSDELPAESIAELSRLTSLRCLSISTCPHHFEVAGTRHLGWWKLPSRLTALGLTGFDLTEEETEPWHSDPDRIGAHFGDLQSLRLHSCALPGGFLLSAAAALPDKLHSLSLVDTDGGGGAGELSCLSTLTALSTLRLMPRGHGVGGLEHLSVLKLRQLKLRLRHMTRLDLLALSRFTTLFVLTLTAPLGEDGRVLPGHEAEVRVSEVEHLISELPYCDVELEMEHPAPDVLIG